LVSHVEKLYVWIIGVTGAGKTTLVGLLTGGKVIGRAGFKHDTIEISEYPAHAVFGSSQAGNLEFISYSIMDTRGYMDAEYTPDIMMTDLVRYPRFHRSKIVIVIKQERLYKLQYDFLKQASKTMKGNLTVVLTFCDQHGIQDFIQLMKEQNIGIAEDRVVCFHLYESNKKSSKELIFKAINKSPFVDIDDLYYEVRRDGIIATWTRLAHRFLKEKSGQLIGWAFGLDEFILTSVFSFLFFLRNMRYRV